MGGTGGDEADANQAYEGGPRTNCKPVTRVNMSVSLQQPKGQTRVEVTAVETSVRQQANAAGLR